ncbi:MAG: VanZ family protein [Candidatus Hydrothermarchaeales archaeon]
MFQWLPFIVYAGFIFYLSAQPYIEIPGGILFLDPESLLLHLIEYIPLGFLAARAVSKTPRLSSYDPFFFPVLISATYGLTDEAHQYFVPGRTASLLDATADALGVIFGVCLWGLLFRKFLKDWVDRKQTVSE